MEVRLGIRHLLHQATQQTKWHGRQGSFDARLSLVPLRGTLNGNGSPVARAQALDPRSTFDTDPSGESPPTILPSLCVCTRHVPSITVRITYLIRRQLTLVCFNGDCVRVETHPNFPDGSSVIWVALRKLAPGLKQRPTS